MLEIQFKDFGPPALVAQCVNASEPGPPSAWEAKVRVDAFPINPADLAMLSGHYGILPTPPSTIGMEAAGTVVECGKSVTDLFVGDKVMIVANNNWAQYRCVPAKLLYRIPKDLDILIGATLKVNPATASMLLSEFVKLTKGSWVIQNAPLSNVGRLVIKFAKSRGFKTINVVRRESEIARVVELGGDIAILLSDDLSQHVKNRIGVARIPLALDAVGGNSSNLITGCCTKGAKVVSYGMLSGEPAQINSEYLIFNDLQHVGFWLSKRLNTISYKERNELFASLIDTIQKLDIQPQLDASFGIGQISQALDFLGGGNGKPIVFPNGIPDDSQIASRLTNELKVDMAND